MKWLVTGTAQSLSLTIECMMPSLGRETLYIMVSVGAVARELALCVLWYLPIWCRKQDVSVLGRNGTIWFSYW